VDPLGASATQPTWPTRSPSSSPDLAAYVTGTTIYVDGAYSINLVLRPKEIPFRVPMLASMVGDNGWSITQRQNWRSTLIAFPENPVDEPQSVPAYHPGGKEPLAGRDGAFGETLPSTADGDGRSSSISTAQAGREATTRVLLGSIAS
jgi:hypothetical protein